MPPQPTGFLVACHDDGYGHVYPLIPGQAITIGRSPDNTITIKDDLISRRHAELFHQNARWVLRDLNSLNGTRVNNERIRGEIVLAAEDEITTGRTKFLFVEDLDQLPARSSQPEAVSSSPGELEITRRLASTRYLPPPAAPPSCEQTIPAPPPTERLPARSGMSEALATLYRLAVEMSEAKTEEELAELVLNALLQSTPAEVGAFVAVSESGEQRLLGYINRIIPGKSYHQVSDTVSQEVMSSRQAVLAEDVSANEDLSSRDSLTELRVASLICAPISVKDTLLGLIHLYSTSTRVRLNSDDLDYTLAVAQHLGTVWQKLRKQTELSAENQVLRTQLRLESELVGRSPALKMVEQQISRVAATKATVLIRGESGVGKELVARAIHFSSPRRDGPFICLNCAALTETLLESELFGHEKGAFTGATERMIGKFEAADRGTIFLDEIGEMTQATQAKLLRVLEGQPFERVGGNVPIKVDVRVVAATNRPLEEAVRLGRFRKDLYFRLQVVQIDVPPLRERPDDVAEIAEHFLRRFARETGRKVKGFSPAAIRKLQAHRWPGNVRELRNVVERAVALGSNPIIDEHDIWLSPLDSGGDSSLPPPAYSPQSLEEMEREHILKTLEHTDWNKSQAAAILGIERSTLDRKIKAFGLRRS